MSLFEPWIGNGIFRNDKTGVTYQSLIAVWADGYATYRSGIEAEILHRDLTLVRLENVSLVREYQNHTSPQFSALVQAVHSGNPVEIGTLEPFTHTDDQQNYLTIDEFPVEPLDRQSGVWPMENVPDALYDPLFGQPAPTEAEIAHYGGLEHVPPMKTYAILDASKFQSGLSEFEDCGLPFRCLFKGDAAEEQKDVAPYLFELLPDSPFVRRLFTHLPDMPETMTTVHMWHREPGIYLRSRAEFDDIWKHFRKFTRIQDENEKWYYFRFWEPKYFAVFSMFANARGRKPVIVVGQTLSLSKAGNYSITPRGNAAALPRITKPQDDLPLFIRSSKFYLIHQISQKHASEFGKKMRSSFVIKNCKVMFNNSAIRGSGHVGASIVTDIAYASHYYFGDDTKVMLQMWELCKIKDEWTFDRIIGLRNMLFFCLRSGTHPFKTINQWRSYNGNL